MIDLMALENTVETVLSAVEVRTGPLDLDDEDYESLKDEIRRHIKELVDDE